MPLTPGSSQKVISQNIKELHAANAGRATPRPNDQIVAIAESNARRTSKGGQSNGKGKR